jgi:hypothetical protein
MLDKLSILGTPSLGYQEKVVVHLGSQGRVLVGEQRRRNRRFLRSCFLLLRTRVREGGREEGRDGPRVREADFPRIEASRAEMEVAI